MDPHEVYCKIEAFMSYNQLFLTEIMHENRQHELTLAIRSDTSPSQRKALKNKISYNLKAVKKYERKIAVITKLKEVYPFWTCSNRSFLPDSNFKGTESEYRDVIKSNILKRAKMFTSQSQFDVYRIQQLKDISEDVMKKGLERFEKDIITDIQIKNVIEEFEKFYQEYSDLKFLQKCDYSLLCDEYAISLTEINQEEIQDFKDPTRNVMLTFNDFQAMILDVVAPLTKLSGKFYKYPFAKVMSPLQEFSFNTAMNLFKLKATKYSINTLNALNIPVSEDFCGCNRHTMEFVPCEHMLYLLYARCVNDVEKDELFVKGSKESREAIAALFNKRLYEKTNYVDMVNRKLDLDLEKRIKSREAILKKVYKVEGEGFYGAFNQKVHPQMYTFFVRELTFFMLKDIQQLQTYPKIALKMGKFIQKVETFNAVYEDCADGEFLGVDSKDIPYL